MSWEINTNEWHNIKNANEETKAEIDRLINYVQQLNHMENLESLNIDRLRLLVDEKEVVIKGESSWEPDTTYVMSSEGMNVNQAEHLQWEESSELIELLNEAPKADEVTMEISYTAMVLLGKEYGCSYWCDDRSVDQAKEGNVQRKIVEYYDSDDSVAFYYLNENGEEDLKFSDEEIRMDDVKSWFDYNFAIEIYVDDEWDDIPEQRDALMNLAEEFVEKYEFFNEAEEPYEDEFTFAESIKLSNEQLEEFRQDLQKFADIANTAEARMDLAATFTVDEGYPFALVDFVVENNEVKIKYCRF